KNVERTPELKSAFRICSRANPSTRLHITASPTIPAALVLSFREAGVGAASVATVDMESRDQSRARSVGNGEVGSWDHQILSLAGAHPSRRLIGRRKSSMILFSCQKTADPRRTPKLIRCRRCGATF